MDINALIQRAKEKDPKALDMIYRTYYPKMLGICMEIIREDKSTASDLVHDAFILAFVSIGSLKDNSKLNGWLTTIVRNVSLKHVEQRDKVHLLSMSSIKDEDAMFVDSSSSPDADLNYKELLGLINRMPEGYSKILRLSVIEGFSHREIADLLGIEPHSSSSQLSRAKRLLKRMIEARIAGIILLLLIPLACYLIFRHEEERHKTDVIVEVPRHEQTKPEVPSENVTEQHDSPEGKHTLPHPVTTRSRKAQPGQATHITLTPDTDSVSVAPQQEISEDALTAETVKDTADAPIVDSIVRINVLPEIKIAEGNDWKVKRSRKKWQFLAAGSLGPALAQNVYKLIATNNSSSSTIGSGDPEPDDPLSFMPKYINTWEEYARYLKAIASPNASADTLELIQFAESKTGRIIQKEHHDKPITFGISLTKSIGRRWCMETGLQYSLLKSQFSPDGCGDTIIDRQKIHYLGIPLRMSYTWMEHKRLSAYSSVGITMHIPIYGKVSGNYYNNWQNIFSENRHLNPPLQWQTGANFGVQYRFLPHASLYAEPTFNWFIPSGSDTHTIWTEHPFMFTCPFGVRITW